MIAPDAHLIAYPVRSGSAAMAAFWVINGAIAGASRRAATGELRTRSVSAKPGCAATAMVATPCA